MKQIHRSKVPLEAWLNGPPPASVKCVGCSKTIGVTVRATQRDNGVWYEGEPTWFWNGYGKDAEGRPLFHTLRCAAAYAEAVVNRRLAALVDERK